MSSRNKRKVLSDDESEKTPNKRRRTTLNGKDNAKKNPEKKPEKKIEKKPEKKSQKKPEKNEKNKSQPAKKETNQSKPAKKEKEEKSKEKEEKSKEKEEKSKEKEENKEKGGKERSKEKGGKEKADTKEKAKEKAKEKGKEKVEEEEVADADVGVVLPLAPPVDVIVVGSGEIGQLGLGKDILEKSKPALIPSLKNKRVAKMAVGGLHVALLVQPEDDPSETSLYTWGCNDQYVLGRSTPSSANEEDDDLSMSPGLVEDLEGKHIVEVTTGEYHMTALDHMGRLYVWGTYKDQEGFLGFTKEHKEIQETPVLHPGLNKTRVKQVASGYNHTIILTDQGKVYNWGFSWIGRRVSSRLKRGNLTPAIVTISLSHPPKVKAVYAGGYHSFIVTEDDKVYSWGLNNAGQLGLGSKTDVATPTEILSLRGEKIAFITGGQHHSLVLTEDGRIFAFGRGEYGQLGHGGEEDASIPIEIKSFTDAGDKVVRVGCGDGHSMAITANGKLYTWGFGERMQLGTNKDQDERVPTNVPFNSYEIVAGGGGGQHSTFLGKKKATD